MVLHAYDVREYLKCDGIIDGEEDGLTIYPDPDKAIPEMLKSSRTRAVLWEKLSDMSGYDSPHWAANSGHVQY